MNLQEIRILSQLNIHQVGHGLQNIDPKQSWGATPPGENPFLHEESKRPASWKIRALLHDIFLDNESAIGTKCFRLPLWFFSLSLFFFYYPFSQKGLSSISMMEHWAEIQDIWVPVSVLSLTEASHFIYLGLGLLGIKQSPSFHH